MFCWLCVGGFFFRVRGVASASASARAALVQFVNTRTRPAGRSASAAPGATPRAAPRGRTGRRASTACPGRWPRRPREEEEQGVLLFLPPPSFLFSESGCGRSIDRLKEREWRERERWMRERRGTGSLMTERHEDEDAAFETDARRNGRRASRVAPGGRARKKKRKARRRGRRAFNNQTTFVDHHHPKHIACEDESARVYVSRVSLPIFSPLTQLMRVTNW